MANHLKGQSWFLQMLEKYNSGMATLAEKTFIEQYLDEIEKQSGKSVSAEELARSITDTRQKLLSSIRKEEERTKQLRIVPVRKYWWAAASLLIVLGAALWFVFLKKEQRTPVVQQNTDLAPGKEKAILTLGDGSTILLDSATNGNLATQGAAKIVKSAKGELQYLVGTGNGVEQQVIYNTVQTPRGGKYNIRLPDGTLVWMNAGSSIRFPTAFTGKERRVDISGEIYFEVAKNPQQPFKVSVNNSTDIEVTGTHFNVNAYTDEPAIKTTLLEGSVNIRSNNASQPVKLMPGQQAVVVKDKKVEVNNGADMEEVMAWKNGYFHFNRADIKTVMRQISRWYDVEIIYDGPVPHDQFIGKIPGNAPASQVLKVLEEMDVHFRIEGKRIIVKQ